MKLFKLLREFVGAFLPFRCHVCQENTDYGLVLCSDCKAQLTGLIKTPFVVDDARCSFPLFTISSYDSFMADVIRILKYRPSAKLLQILSRVCAEKIAESGLINPGDVMIPVPMHSERMQKRGFNQADELAREFALNCACHYSPVLQRVIATRPQADCNEEERLINLQAAFAIDKNADSGAFKNARLILVDDVATTGTTLQQCAKQLEKLRPASIAGLVVSHSFRINPVRGR